MKTHCIRGSVRVTRAYKKSACYCNLCKAHRNQVEYARRDLKRASDPGYMRIRGSQKLAAAARARAKSAGLPCDITAADVPIPERCPVLGICLQSGNGRSTDSSPTVDRLIPALGYVKGNVAVISHKANRMKSDASLEDLRAIVAYMERT